MKKQIETILESHGLLSEFNSGEFEVRIENPPYMRLTIERHQSQVTVTHYFEQNGDLVPDPDMEFTILESGEWFPMAMQFSTGHYSRAAAFRDGKLFANLKVAKDQMKFAGIWARNLKAQGFEHGSAELLT